MSIVVDWQNKTLQVDRLVVASDHRMRTLNSLLLFAQELGIKVVDESNEPQPGDFWLGVLPRAGFGNLPTNQIGWASRHEVNVAIYQLRRALNSGAEDSACLTRLQPTNWVKFFLKGLTNTAIESTPIYVEV